MVLKNVCLTGAALELLTPLNAAQLLKKFNNKNQCLTVLHKSIPLINKAEKDTTWLQSLLLLPISLYVQPIILNNFNKTKEMQCTL